MTPKRFNLLVLEQVEAIQTVLTSKAKEYADDEDRLHNFKVAAAFAGTRPTEECWGFARKHLVSLMDMVKSGKEYPMALWQEKLGDAVNYLILLRACVEDWQRNGCAHENHDHGLPCPDCKV